MTKPGPPRDIGPAMPDTADAAFPHRLLDVIRGDIVPLTRAGVARGDKVFGAAILLKADLSLVAAATNEEMANPLWHGEVSAIRRFHELPADARPAPAECVFLATHEPCSLCLSAITWAGFDNFHYLFAYRSTAEDFAIPHDLRILEEVSRSRMAATGAGTPIGRLTPSQMRSPPGRRANEWRSTPGSRNCGPSTASSPPPTRPASPATTSPSAEPPAPPIRGGVGRRGVRGARAGRGELRCRHGRR